MRLAYWRPPAYAVFFVAASFVATPLYSQHRLRRLEHYVEDLPTNAARGVLSRAAARGNWRELAFAAGEVARGGGDEPRLLLDMATARRDLGDALAHYRALPLFPNEHVPSNEVERRMAR